MTKDILLVNKVESYKANKNTKLKYCWDLKGVSIETQNSLFRE